MKKLTFSLVFLLAYIVLMAQAPQGFNYQAVIRDNSGAIISNQNVSIQISILSGAADGTLEYRENHFKTTNQFGLVNLMIGSETPIVGDFTTIDWGVNSYFLQIAFDAAGGTNYVEMGTSQLLSVPFALQAKKASSYDEADPVFGTSVAVGINAADTTNWNNKLDAEVDGSITNELQTLSISNDTIYLSNGGYAALPKRHYVGEEFGGGIVFHVDSFGYHGLIAANTFIETTEVWSNVSNTLIGSSAQSWWDGEANTTAIISQPGHTNSAAQICRNFTGGGFNDWYLPATHEMRMLFDAGYYVKGIDLRKTYISSCESGQAIAWYVSSLNTSDQGNKAASWFFWPIRKF